MEEKKEKFYVFLDFDGVLYDVKDVVKRKIDGTLCVDSR